VAAVRFTHHRHGVTPPLNPAALAIAAVRRLRRGAGQTWLAPRGAPVTRGADIGQAIGDLLPSAIGVALSPVPIVAVILMLGTPKATSNGPAFALGWVLGLVVVSVIVLLLAGDADDAESGSSTAVNVIKLIFGALFLLLAVQQWRSRPQPGVEPEMPKWMSAIDQFSAGK
jgi:hypothetical protein